MQLKLRILIGVIFFVGSSQLHAQTSCTDIIIPDVITPNGDGINDVLVITCIENFPDNELTIYNRWGELLYKAEGYSNNWAGTNEKNKSELPSGSYAFIFKAKMNGEDKSLTGTISIVR
jgi:gliding motility-associated-like protein